DRGAFRQLAAAGIVREFPVVVGDRARPQCHPRTAYEGIRRVQRGAQETAGAAAGHGGEKQGEQRQIDRPRRMRYQQLSPTRKRGGRRTDVPSPPSLARRARLFWPATTCP